MNADLLTNDGVFTLEWGGSREVLCGRTNRYWHGTSIWATRPAKCSRIQSCPDDSGLPFCGSDNGEFDGEDDGDEYDDMLDDEDDEEVDDDYFLDDEDENEVDDDDGFDDLDDE